MNVAKGKPVTNKRVVHSCFFFSLRCFQTHSHSNREDEEVQKEGALRNIYPFMPRLLSAINKVTLSRLVEFHSTHLRKREKRRGINSFLSVSLLLLCAGYQEAKTNERERKQVIFESSQLSSTNNNQTTTKVKGRTKR